MKSNRFTSIWFGKIFTKIEFCHDSGNVYKYRCLTIDCNKIYRCDYFWTRTFRESAGRIPLIEPICHAGRFLTEQQIRNDQRHNNIKSLCNEESIKRSLVIGLEKIRKSCFQANTGKGQYEP